MRELARWPLLLAAAVLVAGAIGVDYVSSERGYLLAAVLLGLGASCVGAFLYAEGARHREWWARRDTPGRHTTDCPPDAVGCSQETPPRAVD